MHRATMFRFRGFQPKTEIWFSEKVLEHLAMFKKRRRGQYDKFLMRLERCAKNGFSIYERDGPIRFEGDGVYRIGIPADLFRILGFYENGNRACFIGIDAIFKRGQTLGETDREHVRSVIKVLQNDDWEKVKDEPKLRLSE